MRTKTLLFLLFLLLLLNGCDKGPRTAPSPDKTCSTTLQKKTGDFSSKTGVKNQQIAEQAFIIRTMTVTSYCACELCTAPFCDGITANGHRIRPGDRFVAAPAEIPFGTLISIPGYAGGLPVPVYDRGGSIRKNKIDVYLDTHQAALQWGRQTLDVIIYK